MRTKDSLKLFWDECDRQGAPIDIISFDIFDTLFVRPLADPEDLFDLLGERFGVKDFRRIRKEAQVEAFRRMVLAGKGEITLNDIYTCIVTLPSHVTADALRDGELELELELTIPNPDLIELFSELAAERSVAVISDMYLPRTFFEALFDRHGLPRVPMFVSSEHGATKRDKGELFDRLVKELDVPAERVLHVGDNPVSDVQRARERGLRAFHYINERAASYAISPGLGTSIAASMAKLHEQRWPINSFYGLGFCFGGAAATGFLEWIADQARLDRIDVLLFVARDGFILNELAMRGHVSGLPKHGYFPGSRVSFALATINDLNFDGWLDFLLSGGYGLSPDEVLERIGVPLPAKVVMDDVGLGDGVVLDQSNIGRMRDFLSVYRGEIIKVAVRNRRGLFSLLGRAGVRPGMRIAMVDVGWNGTTQETFQSALAGMLDVELFGYYLALTDSAECRGRRSRMAMKALLESTSMGAGRIARLYDRRVGVELMFSAPHEAIIGYEVEPGRAVRVIEDPGRGADTAALREAVAEIQRGMLDFADRYRAIVQRINYRARPHELAQSVIDFAHMATEHCSVLDTLSNFDAWGSSRNHSLSMSHYE